MSASRKSSKRLKAMTTGLDNGVKSAGATSIGLNALGLCVTISNPVILAIAGSVGTLFCCLGICYDCRQPDSEEEPVVVEYQEQNKERVKTKKTAFAFPLFSRGKTQKEVNILPSDLTIDDLTIPFLEEDEPDDMEMEDVQLKKSSSFRL